MLEQRLQRLIAWIGLCVVVLLVIAVMTSRALPPVGAADDNDGDDRTYGVLAASGSLEANAVDTSEPVRFHLTVANVSDREVTSVRITRVGTTAITLASADWCQAGTGASALAQCQVSAALTPRQSVTVSGTLVATASTRGTVNATLAWAQRPTDTSTAAAGASGAQAAQPSTAGGSQTAQAVASTAVVRIGTLTVTPWPARFAAELFSSLPAWAVPIILVALGYFVQQRLTDFQSQREQHEKDRAEKAEAWRTMLPISHEYAVRYYAPLIAAADSLVQNAQKVIAIPPPDPKREPPLEAAFYALVMFQVRRNQLVNNTYYFKNHVGEQLVSGLFTAFGRRFLGERDVRERAAAKKQADALRLLDRATAAVDAADKKHVVLEKMAYEMFVGSGPLPELMTWLRGRLERGGATEALTYLDAYGAVLAFEMNRPYARWFDRQAELILTPQQEQAVRDMVRDVGATDPQMSAVAAELEQYFAEAGKKVVS
jgi:hypothetical protein